MDSIDICFHIVYCHYWLTFLINEVSGQMDCHEMLCRHSGLAQDELLMIVITLVIP